MDFNGKALYFVAVKVFLRRGHDLLLTHDIFGSWDLPGGRIKPDEFDTPIEIVIERKIREELGDKVKYKLIGATDTFFRVERNEATADDKPVQIFAVSFEAEYLGGDIELGEHHDELRWVDVRSFIPKALFEGGWLIGVEDYVKKVNNREGADK